MTSMKNPYLMTGWIMVALSDFVKWRRLILGTFCIILANLSWRHAAILFRNEPGVSTEMYFTVCLLSVFRFFAVEIEDLALDSALELLKLLLR
jgi:hypothetical protein